MSNDMLNKAFASSLPHVAAARLLYVALANRCNDRSECWPGIARLRKDTGISERRIVRLLRQLERNGLLTIRPPRPGRKANTYRLTPPCPAPSDATAAHSMVDTPGARARGGEILTVIDAPGARATRTLNNPLQYTRRRDVWIYH
jgi:hypothetical protein